MSSGPHQYAGLSVCSAAGQPQQCDVASGGMHNSSVSPENMPVLSTAYTASNLHAAPLLSNIHQPYPKKRLHVHSGHDWARQAQRLRCCSSPNKLQPCAMSRTGLHMLRAFLRPLPGNKLAPLLLPQQLIRLHLVPWAQEVAASTGDMADTLSLAQQQVEQLQEAHREQEHSLAALEGKAVSPEALQQLAGTVGAVASDLEAARAEAAKRESCAGTSAALGSA